MPLPVQTKFTKIRGWTGRSLREAGQDQRDRGPNTGKMILQAHLQKLSTMDCSFMQSDEFKREWRAHGDAEGNQRWERGY
mmetsp:Transcript_1388/g.2318  ORF Transcript_1388/g.2318 Transcript_1388/m.2318 type:complete len:80 (+) Transcript_1388:276-515(+)